MTEDEFEQLPRHERIEWVWKNTPSKRKPGKTVTINELAAMAGVSTQTIYEWKRPTSGRWPDPEQAEKLSRISGFPARLFARPPGAASVTLEEIDRRLRSLEEQVATQGTATTKSLATVARDLRSLARQLEREDDSATQAGAKP